MKGLSAIPCVVFLAASAASATTLQSLDFDDLVGMADGVVIGTVDGIQVHQANDGTIYRYVTFGDLEVLTGAYGEAQITLRFEGGALGREVLVVHGSPEFEEGERVVLFVEGNGERVVPLVGWEQGLFRVQVDPSGATAITDSVGNRVFGIDDDVVLKEQRFAPRAELVGPEGPGLGRSEAPGISFGMTETGADGQADQPVDIELEALAGRVMSVEDLAREIEATAASTGFVARQVLPMISVEPGDEPPSETFDAGLADGIEPEQAIRQDRSPGRLPSRILPELDTEID